MATAHATTIAVKAAGASGSWDASGGRLVDARTAAIRRMIMNPIMQGTATITAASPGRYEGTNARVDPTPIAPVKDPMISPRPMLPVTSGILLNVSFICRNHLCFIKLKTILAVFIDRMVSWHPAEIRYEDGDNIIEQHSVYDAKRYEYGLLKK